MGGEVQGDYAMQCLIKHDKADVGSPLLEAAPVQVFDHSGDTCFTVVASPNIRRTVASRTERSRQAAGTKHQLYTDHAYYGHGSGE